MSDTMIEIAGVASAAAMAARLLGWAGDLPTTAAQIRRAQVPDVEAILKVTAPYRHYQRVLQARAAMDTSCPADVPRQAWREILADLDALQGRSARIEPLLGLGKGRKHASDGAAWDAAIQAAAAPKRGRWVKDPHITVNGEPCILCYLFEGQRIDWDRYSVYAEYGAHHELLRYAEEDTCGTF